jgi:hypothetical protein
MNERREHMKDDQKLLIVEKICDEDSVNHIINLLAKSSDDNSANFIRDNSNKIISGSPNDRIMYFHMVLNFKEKILAKDFFWELREFYDEIDKLEGNDNNNRMLTGETNRLNENKENPMSDIFNDSFTPKERITKRLEKFLFGPGSEKLDDDDIENEEISDYPLNRYITGILFPSSGLKKEVEDKTIGIPLGSEDEGEEINEEENEEENEGEKEEVNEIVSSLRKKTYPSSMGIMFCVAENTKLLVTFNFAEYLPDDDAKKWKRKQCSLTDSIKITNNIEPEKELLRAKIQGFEAEIVIKRNIKVFRKGKNLHVFLYISNQSESKENIGFYSNSPLLNLLSLFQANIHVKAENGLFLANHIEKNVGFDTELKLLNYIYRDIKSFASGKNCSVDWEDSKYPKSIWTTFIPKYDLKNITTSRDDIDKETLSVKNLSMFGDLKDETLFQKIKENIVNKYGAWIKSLPENNENDKDIKNKQLKILERLTDGVSLLEQNRQALRCFKLANTSMFIQLVLSAKEKYGIHDTSQLNNWDFYKTIKSPQYRLFQLAYLILNIEPIVNNKSQRRKDEVELLYFPTGGGKTEAYFAVMAFTVFWERLFKGNTGVIAILRYTLRLLSAQQFERVLKLVFAIQYVAKKKDLNIDIAAGLWVGSSLTPNTIEQAIALLDGGGGATPEIFPIKQCPWCGSDIEYKTNLNRDNINCKCSKEDCFYYEKDLPFEFIDEKIYDKKPTILFGTIDKFVQLAWKEQSIQLFSGKNKPALIIQDELHLISGPIGSLFAVFENVVESLCTTDDGVSPRIISSTATARNASEQVKSLFGGKTVEFFPAFSSNPEDMFFATSEDKSRRRYLGVTAAGVSNIEAQIRVMAALIFTRLENYSDKYWTVLSYFNSLKELGIIKNKFNQDIKNHVVDLHKRLFGEDWENTHPQKDILSRNIELNNQVELTSNVTGDRIKSSLTELESSDRFRENQATDAAFASIMISVGLDISRLNMMIINGHPKNNSEYLQVSSRVSRRDEGVVVTVYNMQKNRDTSHFENFKKYHSEIYKSIEPLSLTPYTPMALEKILKTMIVAFIRNKLQKDVRKVNSEDYNFLEKYLQSRLPNEKRDTVLKEIECLIKGWITAAKNGGITSYNNQTIIPSSKGTGGSQFPWKIMQSLRDVDTNTKVFLYLNGSLLHDNNGNPLATKTQTRKMVSRYGGIGSIVETSFSAVKVRDFDNWPCSSDMGYINNNAIKDDRLMSFLRQSSFPELRRLFWVPSSSEYLNNGKVRGVQADIFPKWHFCPMCKKFGPVNRWIDAGINGEQAEVRYDGFFHKCGNNQKVKLEQTQFVVICEKNGEIRDVPWFEWLNGERFVSNNNTYPEEGWLEFYDSSNFSEKKIRHLKNENSVPVLVKEISMERFYNQIFWEGDYKYVTENRVSTRTYFPKFIVSPYIPIETNISEDVAIYLLDAILKTQDMSIKDQKKIKDTVTTMFPNITMNEIDLYLNRCRENIPKDEEEFKRGEYNFFKKGASSDQNILVENSIPEQNSCSDYFDSFSKISKLKITVVQIYYQRGSDQREAAEKKYTSSQRPIMYLPAIENFGEGIFISLGNTQISSWIEQYKEHFAHFNEDPKYYLIHSFSHALLKELEFSCGYSATSLSERIYCSEDYAGILIYTTAGKDGSMGGLAGQLDKNRLTKDTPLIKIIENAIERVKNCSNDPVCINSERDDDNYSACYSCLLLPETSCENYNKKLDRNLLINEKYGFFKDLKITEVYEDNEVVEMEDADNLLTDGNNSDIENPSFEIVEDGDIPEDDSDEFILEKRPRGLDKNTIPCFKRVYDGDNISPNPRYLVLSTINGRYEYVVGRVRRTNIGFEVYVSPSSLGIPAFTAHRDDIIAKLTGGTYA